MSRPRRSIRPTSRVLRLALLAPDIVEAILDGRQPPELNSPRLMPRKTEALLAAGLSEDAVEKIMGRNLRRGRCQVVGLMAARGRAARRRAGSDCGLDARLLAPGWGGLVAGVAVVGGGHQVPQTRKAWSRAWR